MLIRHTRASLACAVTFTLCTDIVSQHGSQNEIFFRTEQVQGPGYHQADGIDTFRLAENKLMRSSSTG